MPITTFCEPWYVAGFKCSDKDINALISEINNSQKKTFAVREIVDIQRKWFKRVETKRYELLAHLGDWEWQVINFRMDHDWTINTTVSAAHIANYLYGFLAGMNKKFSEGV